VRRDGILWPGQVPISAGSSVQTANVHDPRLVATLGPSTLSCSLPGGSAGGGEDETDQTTRDTKDDQHQIGIRPRCAIRYGTLEIHTVWYKELAAIKSADQSSQGRVKSSQVTSSQVYLRKSRVQRHRPGAIPYLLPRTCPPTAAPGRPFGVSAAMEAAEEAHCSLPYLLPAGLSGSGNGCISSIPHPLRPPPPPSPCPGRSPPLVMGWRLALRDIPIPPPPLPLSQATGAGDGDGAAVITSLFPPPSSPSEDGSPGVVLGANGTRAISQGKGRLVLPDLLEE
jgi:hypothetical protein